MIPLHYRRTAAGLLFPSRTILTSEAVWSRPKETIGILLFQEDELHCLTLQAKATYNPVNNGAVSYCDGP